MCASKVEVKPLNHCHSNDRFLSRIHFPIFQCNLVLIVLNECATHLNEFQALMNRASPIWLLHSKCIFIDANGIALAQNMGRKMENMQTSRFVHICFLCFFAMRYAYKSLKAKCDHFHFTYISFMSMCSECKFKTQI